MSVNAGFGSLSAARKRNARLECPGVGTLDVPWWPDVDYTIGARTWTTQERPGRTPLNVNEAKSLAEYRVSYMLRYANGASVAPHIKLLGQMAQSTTAVILWLGTTRRGVFHFADAPSIVELLHKPDGTPVWCDVSMTLREASSATVKVGPVPPRRNTKPSGIGGGIAAV